MDRGNQVICHGCKEKFYKDELTYVTKSKRLCKKCQDTIQVDSNEFKKLVEYICQGFGLKAPTGQQLRSIKEFKNLGYSYRDIRYTLYYIYCIEKRKIEGTSIGLVPYYYEKAMEHSRLVENAKKTAKKVAMQEITINRNTEVYIPYKNKTRLINIEELI